MLKRLKDWWTRPSWEEYLAEHQECVDLHNLIDALNCKLDRALGANEALHEDFASRLADAQIALDRKVKEKMDVFRESEDLRFEFETEKYAHTQEISRLEREIDRLQGLLMDQIDKTPLQSIVIQDGSVEVSMSPPHWAIRAMAMSFYDTLADAPNWNSMEVGPLEHEGVKLVVTVRRMDGDTPEETVGKLRDTLAEWHDFYGGERNGDGDMVARTLALINPMKKDA